MKKSWKPKPKKLPPKMIVTVTYPTKAGRERYVQIRPALDLLKYGGEKYLKYEAAVLMETILHDMRQHAPELLP